MKHICETDPNKHKTRDNKFGITWCLRCGRLFDKPCGKPITDLDREKHLMIKP
jgi:ribosomal protein L37AE/L43A